MAQQTFAAVPILRIFDVEKASDFYLGFLGMHFDWEHRFEAGAPLYMQVLTRRPGAAPDRAPRRLLPRQHGLRAHHRTRRLPPRDHREGLPPMRPGIETMPWNARMMTVIDPFGNRLRFNEYRAG